MNSGQRIRFQLSDCTTNTNETIPVFMLYCLPYDDDVVDDDDDDESDFFRVAEHFANGQIACSRFYSTDGPRVAQMNRSLLSAHGETKAVCLSLSQKDALRHALGSALMRFFASLQEYERLFSVQSEIRLETSFPFIFFFFSPALFSDIWQVFPA